MFYSTALDSYAIVKGKEHKEKCAFGDRMRKRKKK